MEKIDFGIVNSIFHLIIHGLHPGSCCAAIVDNDYDLAKRLIHPHSLPHLPNIFNVCRNILPNELLNKTSTIEDWMEHNGLSGNQDAHFTYMLTHGDILSAIGHYDAVLNLHNNKKILIDLIG